MARRSPFAVLLSDAEYEELSVAARRANLSRGELIRRAIDEATKHWARLAEEPAEDGRVEYREMKVGR